MINGVELEHHSVGEGPPILLISGTHQPAVTWHLGSVELLVDAGYSVVTYDNRGTAPSGSTPSPYSVEMLAGDAAALIEDLQLGPCFVAGLSLGAFITQELCLARPDLVRAGVMMGTLADQPAIGLAWCESQIEMLRQGIIPPPEYLAMQTAYTIFSPARLFDDDFIVPFLTMAGSLVPETGDGPIGQLEADRSYGGRLDALAKIDVPTLVVCFEHDLLTPPHLGRAVARAIPGAELIELAGLGHAGPIEDPHPVAAELVRFFGSH